MVEPKSKRVPNTMCTGTLLTFTEIFLCLYMGSATTFGGSAPLVLECASDEVRRKIEAATPSPSKPIGTSGATAATSPAESPPERSSMSGAAPSN